MRLKSEIRISKYETISKLEYQMTKTFRVLIQYLQGFDMFRILDFCHSYLFRISCFEFRISGKIIWPKYNAYSTSYRFKWLSPEGTPEQATVFDVWLLQNNQNDQDQNLLPFIEIANFCASAHTILHSFREYPNRQPHHGITVKNYWHYLVLIHYANIFHHNV